MGNRKPRRVMKGHPHAGHMGDEFVTLARVPVLGITIHDDKTYVVMK